MIDYDSQFLNCPAWASLQNILLLIYYVDKLSIFLCTESSVASCIFFCWSKHFCFQIVEQCSYMIWAPTNLMMFTVCIWHLKGTDKIWRFLFGPYKIFQFSKVPLNYLKPLIFLNLRKLYEKLNLYFESMF